MRRSSWVMTMLFTSVLSWICCSSSGLPAIGDAGDPGDEGDPGCIASMVPSMLFTSVTSQPLDIWDFFGELLVMGAGFSSSNKLSPQFSRYLRLDARTFLISVLVGAAIPVPSTSRRMNRLLSLMRGRSSLAAENPRVLLSSRMRECKNGWSCAISTRTCTHSGRRFELERLMRPRFGRTRHTSITASKDMGENTSVDRSIV
mmetsp:Transcript_49427/g.88328  ORF Transcript_49427/g.88328 Transcript_49427/m.88328 type:complete len:202 (+) Transcript_49427:3422-4027(+)